MNTTRMAWFPVNCCCQPDVLFGFLRLPEAGGSKLTIVDRYGETHPVELKRLNCHKQITLREVFERRDAGLDYPDPETLQELAVYSDDRPIDFWRTIPDFVEAVDKRRPM